ncbi:MAG: hypothetical protein KatS3mg011_1435 [Acidimicrobiia bacterium]|nr:MAG: hypothetical protein KatS3mg011_1435 [Acidimicrobiia bacterium]
MRIRPVDARGDLPHLEELFRVVTECDGHPPIGEHKYLDLLHPEPDRVAGLVAEDGEAIVAYLALSPTQQEDTWAMELAVHPMHRNPATLNRLVETGLEFARTHHAKKMRVWAFQPNVADVLERAGFSPERELRQLRRPLPHPERPAFPAGVVVRGFRPGIDEEDWLKVNNAAFAGHPENGAWTREILADREAQEWFDPEGFRMAWEEDSLVGFCWTKVHPPFGGPPATHRGDLRHRSGSLGPGSGIGTQPRLGGSPLPVGGPPGSLGDALRRRRQHSGDRSIRRLGFQTRSRRPFLRQGTVTEASKTGRATLVGLLGG